MNKMMTLLVGVVLLVSACTDKPSGETTASGLKRTDFQTEVDGKQTDLFVLKNKNGMEVCITNFGGRIVSVMVPDKEGAMKDVVLGFDSIQDYIKYPSDFGASIGRYANRINQGRITVDGVEYQLPQNNYGHCLHGGPRGFQYQVFDARPLSDQALELTYLSKDGEEGFPGNLTCKVIFTLTDDNAIDIRYSAETDRTTVVNMTNHSYFNLDGNPSGTNSDYLLTIDADSYTPVDSTFMTTGEIASVEGTDMDFRQPVAVGARINNDFVQLKYGKGYDHNWVLNTRGDDSRPCATLESPLTGIVLDVYTNEPGVQIYAGNFLDGTLTGKKGIVYNHRASVCLETQKYPDTPNKPEWPSALLKPGEKYDSHCIYKFSVKK
ncbi:aldose epimerase family protein [Bacteroides sp.]|uniref:aldose epimerase family protein n=1 Tax=Bacteroides sp. TaxID=29523 RepID=UPI002632206F|nr:aldose epimerase family protein [Bacteroides sp.]